MRADPAWQAARAIPRTQKQERQRAFGALREQYGFSEYALHDAAKGLNCSWIADHVDAVLAQTLATRAYRALNRVCLGQARRVRFQQPEPGISSVENKRNNTGLRFVLQPPEEGNTGYLLWQDDRLPALIDWKDPVVPTAWRIAIKYARLIQRQASSARAQGADGAGPALLCATGPGRRPVPQAQTYGRHDTVGLDLGPSTIAIVPREGTPRLEVFCAELAPDAQAIRRLQRQMDRQRRANNPDNYDEKGRIRTAREARLTWKQSKRYLATRRRKATRERKLAAHRKSLHGRLVHEIVAIGNTVITEKISYRAWQKQFGKSVGLRAPGMFIDMLKRTVASTGGTLVEVPTRTTKLSQFCHGCGQLVPKPLWQRWHECPCGVGPIQRDLYSAFLAAYLDPADLLPSCARQRYAAGWEGAEPRLRAAYESSHPTRKCGAASASLLRYPRSQSASAQKSMSSHTRARLLSSDGKRGSKARNLQGFSPERSQKASPGQQPSATPADRQCARCRRYGPAYRSGNSTSG